MVEHTDSSTSHSLNVFPCSQVSKSPCPNFESSASFAINDHSLLEVVPLGRRTTSLF